MYISFSHVFGKSFGDVIAGSKCQLRQLTANDNCIVGVSYDPLIELIREVPRNILIQYSIFTTHFYKGEKVLLWSEHDNNEAYIAHSVGLNRYLDKVSRDELTPIDKGEIVSPKDFQIEQYYVCVSREFGNIEVLQCFEFAGEKYLGVNKYWCNSELFRKYISIRKLSIDTETQYAKKQCLTFKGINYENI